jgi:urease accessory protein
LTSTPHDQAPGIGRLMSALQFGDSLLPTGSFSFSNGLESAVQQHIVHDRGTLAEFALTTARRSAATDGICLLEAHRGARAGNLGRVRAADHAAFNRKLSEEARTMTVRTGRKLAELATCVVPAPVIRGWLGELAAGQTPGTYPAALGVAFAALGSPEEDAFAVLQYGVAATTLSAALRLMRVEPHQVQAILRQVNAGNPELYAEVRGASLDDMAGFAPMADILASMHVRAHVRMFMN